MNLIVRDALVGALAKDLCDDSNEFSSIKYRVNKIEDLGNYGLYNHLDEMAED